ncbi:MAG: MAPEG family protein [Pseudohongiellaceae bacterium]
MEWVAIIVVLALLQYLAFGMLVGRARGRYEVKAPAISGHPVFERYYRVHQNTLESLILFLPALLIFATYASASVGAGIGVVYLLGRQLYLRAYVKDPASRGPGFLLTLLPTVVLLIGGGVAAGMLAFGLR